MNVVRDAAGGAPSEMGGYPTAPGAAPSAGSGQPPPPPPPGPLPRIQCPECEFTFIVGDIVVATCPNCGAEVRTGAGSSEEE
ncbi:MAG TPA: hypothetical protein VE027_02680 [Acidimicrobiia bacterium]|nr:hypothetical protein [Acidimicrobiia bacterium]